MNNLTTTYNEKAIFYDEQPDSFKVSIKQRTRWVKGYFEARKIYIKEIRRSLDYKDKNYGSKISTVIGVQPLIYLLIGVLLLIVSSLTINDITAFIKTLVVVLLLIYLELAGITYIIIKSEKNKLNLNVSKTKLTLYNPLFLLSYILCLMISIFKRNLGWEEIKHNKKLAD